MPSSSRLRWLSALVVMVGFGVGSQAHAGGKVDWSEYLEPPGARPPMRKATAAAEEPAPTKASAKKASHARPAKKKAAAKAKRARPARKHH